MQRPEEQHVLAMRNLLAEARPENSRMVAAAIGGHLSRLSRELGREAGEVGKASDVVRDASLDLLKALHCGQDIHRARKAALDSVETLEAALPDTSGLTRLPGRAEPGASVSPKAIRALAARRLKTVLPLWKS